jgi:acyl transferase domain-containing protein
LILAVEGVLALMNMSFLSPSGRCFSFDRRADGYSRGEGFGVVLVKRLSDAIRDRNTIRAIIRSTGSNQDGHTPGLTQPSRELQAVLIRETYEKAGLDIHQTRFFEAHGKFPTLLSVSS